MSHSRIYLGSMCFRNFEKVLIFVQPAAPSGQSVKAITTHVTALFLSLPKITFLQSVLLELKCRWTIKRLHFSENLWSTLGYIYSVSFLNINHVSVKIFNFEVWNFYTTQKSLIMIMICICILYRSWLAWCFFSIADTLRPIIYTAMI